MSDEVNFELKTKDGQWLYFEMGGIASWSHPGASPRQCIFDTYAEAKEVIEEYGLTDAVITRTTRPAVF